MRFFVVLKSKFWAKNLAKSKQKCYNAFVKNIQSALDFYVPNPKCELNFSSVFELLVAVILSAQCTDKRVNQVTAKMFKKWNTPQDFANLNPKELEQEIHSLGFFRNKAKSIINASNQIIQDFGGHVPSDFDALCSLSGVGRKTASVIMAEGFKKPAVAVDTHVFRVANRLGIGGKTVDKTEQKLKSLFPKRDWAKIHLQMVLFGRNYCKAKKPLCQNCKLKNICKYGKKIEGGVE